MIWMDVDTALSEVPVNSVALTDDTDFKTREESVVFNQAGLDLVWNFVTTAGAFTQTAVTPTNTGGDYDWINQGNGDYTIEIPASGGVSINNDTEGFGYFSGVATGILPWRGPTIGFRAAALNNALIDGGDSLDVNTIEISGGSGAADNLEAMYDGTGYADDKAPATQEDVRGIGSGGSSALNFPVSADNTGGAINSVTFVGTQTGTYVNTESNPTGTYHQITHATNDIDLVYEIDVGDTKVATEVVIGAYLNGNGDTINIEVWDHVGSDWETFYTLAGTNGSANTEIILDLFSKHTGTLGSANAGLVWVRFDDPTGTGQDLYVGRVVCAAVASSTTIGYDQASVWVDETNGTSTGTVLGVDATAANRADTFANAKTVADNLGYTTITNTPGNSINLPAAALEGYYINNVQCTLTGPGSGVGHDVTSTRISGGFIDGTWHRDTGGSGIPTFVGCSILTGTTMERAAFLQGCGFVGTFTLAEAGLYPIVDCQAGGPTGIATFDFNSLAATMNFEGWKGSATFNNLASGATVNIHCAAGGNIVLNGADATVEITGTVGTVTNNLTGSPTVTNNGISLVNINAEADTAITDNFNLSAGVAEADVLKISGSTTAADNLEQHATGVVLGTASGTPTTTTMPASNLAATVDDFYNGKIVTFTSGTLLGQSTDVTDYAGGTKTLTFTALTAAPLASDTFVLT